MCLWFEFLIRRLKKISIRENNLEKIPCGEHIFGADWGYPFQFNSKFNLIETPLFATTKKYLY